MMGLKDMLILFVICPICMGTLYNRKSDFNIKNHVDLSYGTFSMDKYKHKPDDKHLDPERLMKRIRNSFDPVWMSVENPESSKDMIVSGKKVPYSSHLLPEIAKLNFTMVDDKGNLVDLKDKERKVIEKWLLQGSSCQVYYSWQDLGILFWPRWIKRGVCDTSVSCSWPPGMYCVPTKSDPLRILHWTCGEKPRKHRNSVRKNKFKTDVSLDKQQMVDFPMFQETTPGHVIRDHEIDFIQRMVMLERRRNNRKRKTKLKCRWKKVRYPITTDCYCSC